MEIHRRARVTRLILLLMLAGGCALDADDTDDTGDLSQEEELPDTVPKAQSIGNGLRAINGLSSINGLLSINGLTLRNGLALRNGLVSINGLATRNGLSTVNGSSVNCAGSNSCTGLPDGLLNKSALMKDEAGVNLASYLIRCALPADRTITVQRWDDQRVSLNGEVGFAPEWETGRCSTECQEKVSACLLALVNGSGKHVRIAMSAAWASGLLRQIPNSGWLQEAVFFGNIFTDPPKAYVAIHRDWARALTGLSGDDVVPVPRMCSGVPGIKPADYFSQYKHCPIKIVGEAGHVIEGSIPGPLAGRYDLCYMENRGGRGGQALSCYDARTANREHVQPNEWHFPLTTFVSSPVW